MMPARRLPPAPQPQPSDRLRLGQCGWSDPETFTIAKETIAAGGT
jgi:hypothetical protein